MVLAFGEYTLDLPRRELRRRQSLVPVQPKAFDLLVYLIRHRDRVVGKDELLRELWADEVVTEWALTFSIKLVREALGDRAGKNALVRTVHRRGFRFMGEAQERNDNAPAASAGAAVGLPWTAASSTQWKSVLGRDDAAAFCGRVDEMSRLAGLLERALAGELTTAFVAGDPGIGKTRLAIELAREAADRGALVLAGRCDEGAPPVFWPWVQIIRAYLAAHTPEQFLETLGAGADDISRLVIALRPYVSAAVSEQTLDSDHLQLRMLDSISGFLAAAAQRQPLLLVLDDLQWADTSSILALRSLLDTAVGAPLMILATLRDAEVDADSALGRFLVLLRRGQRCTEMRLGGLSRTEARQLLGGSGVPAQAWLDINYGTTDGNPFFLEELWRDANERGGFDEAGVRQASSIPSLVRDVVLQRIDRLTPATRDLLALASVIGREFDLTIVHEAGAIAADAVTSSIDEALRAHVIGETAGPTKLRFVHAIVQEALYGRLSGPRRADCHWRIGLALERARGNDSDELPEIAHHFFRAVAGRTSGPIVEQALRYARLAGDEAKRRLSYAEAAVCRERVITLLERAPQRDDVALIDAIIELGWSYGRADEPELARRTLLRAIDMARRAELNDRFVQAAIEIGRGHQGIGGSETEVIGLLEEALLRLPDDAFALRAMCLARLNYALCTVAGTQARRAPMGDEALALARRGDDPATLLWVLLYNRWAYWGPQTAAARGILVDELKALAQRVRGTEQELEVYRLYVTDLIETGDMATADAAMRRWQALNDQLRLPWQRWFLLRLRAVLAQQDGRFAEAESYAEQALTVGQRVKHPYAPHFYIAQISMLRVHRGQYAEVEPLLEAYMQSPRPVPAWRAILAYLYGENGKPELMRREFEAMAAGDFSDLPQDVIWLNGMAYLAEVCHALGDRERAGILYEQLSPFEDRVIGVAFGTFSLGHASRYLGLLAATLGRDEDAERHLLRAIDMHTRLRARAWLAASHHDYAQWLVTRKRTAAARKHLDAARAIATELGLNGLIRKLTRRRAGARDQSPRVKSRRHQKQI